MSVYISQRKSFQVRGLFPTRFLTAFKNTLLITLLAAKQTYWMPVLSAGRGHGPNGDTAARNEASETPSIDRH